jgi:hypothetical protein
MDSQHVVVSLTPPPGTLSPVGPVNPEPAWRNKTWREAEGQRETAVRLQRLPPGLTFPDNFPEPITYDPARKLLVYRGFMCHGSYQFLHQLAGDPAYVAAIDQLYQESCSPPRARIRWGGVGAAFLLALRALAGLWWWVH